MKISKGYIRNFSESEYNFAFSLMTEERQKAVSRKMQENQRKQSVLGEFLAKKAISELCGMDISEIQFERTKEGKPFAKNVDVEFCISHSNDMVACAVSEKQVGIDCELIRDIDLRITKIACTDSDKEFIFAADSEKEQKIRFFKVWTAKEAYFKFLGTGITNLKSVDYKEIEKNCQVETENGYIITVYTERER